MIRITTLLFIYLSLFLFDRTYGQEENDSTEFFYTVDEMPSFPKGNKGINKIISNNFKYPESAIRDSLGGEIIVSFVVDTSGNLKNIKIEEGIRQDLNNEAIRIVSLLNGWKPGKFRGDKLDVYMKLPITFNWEPYLLTELKIKEKREQKSSRKYLKKNRLGPPQPVY